MNFHAKIKNNICFLNKINDTVVTLMNTRFLGITLVHQYNQTTTNTYTHINSELWKGNEKEENFLFLKGAQENEERKKQKFKKTIAVYGVDNCLISWSSWRKQQKQKLLTTIITRVWTFLVL